MFLLLQSLVALLLRLPALLVPLQPALRLLSLLLLLFTLLLLPLLLALLVLLLALLLALIVSLFACLALALLLRLAVLLHLLLLILLLLLLVQPLVAALLPVLLAGLFAFAFLAGLLLALLALVPVLALFPGALLVARPFAFAPGLLAFALFMGAAPVSVRARVGRVGGVHRVGRGHGRVGRVRLRVRRAGRIHSAAAATVDAAPVVHTGRQVAGIRVVEGGATGQQGAQPGHGTQGKQTADGGGKGHGKTPKRQRSETTVTRTAGRPPGPLKGLLRQHCNALQAQAARPCMTPRDSLWFTCVALFYPALPDFARALRKCAGAARPWRLILQPFWRHRYKAVLHNAIPCTCTT